MECKVDIVEVVVRDITEESAHKFRNKVLAMSALFPEKPIKIYINSNGGCLDALATMIETIKSVPNDIHTICIGKAYSAGAMLLSFGDKRYCGIFSNVMLHEIQLSDLPDMSSLELKDLEKEIEDLNKFWFTIIAKNCKLTYPELRKKIKGKDISMRAKAAKKIGLIDVVGVPKETEVFILKKDDSGE